MYAPACSTVVAPARFLLLQWPDDSALYPTICPRS